MRIAHGRHSNDRRSNIRHHGVTGKRCRVAGRHNHIHIALGLHDDVAAADVGQYVSTAGNGHIAQADGRARHIAAGIQRIGRPGILPAQGVVAQSHIAERIDAITLDPQGAEQAEFVGRHLELAECVAFRAAGHHMDIAPGAARAGDQAKPISCGAGVLDIPVERDVCTGGCQRRVSEQIDSGIKQETAGPVCSDLAAKAGSGRACVKCQAAQRRIVEQEPVAIAQRDILGIGPGCHVDRAPGRQRVGAALDAAAGLRDVDVSGRPGHQTAACAVQRMGHAVLDRKAIGRADEHGATRIHVGMVDRDIGGVVPELRATANRHGRLTAMTIAQGFNAQASAGGIFNAAAYDIHGLQAGW